MTSSWMRVLWFGPSISGLLFPVVFLVVNLLDALPSSDVLRFLRIGAPGSQRVLYRLPHQGTIEAVLLTPLLEKSSQFLRSDPSLSVPYAEAVLREEPGGVVLTGLVFVGSGTIPPLAGHLD